MQRFGLAINRGPGNLKQMILKVWRGHITAGLFTNIWKSDHCLNVTLGRDIKFTLTFLPAKSLCWRKWILSYFKTPKLWTEDNLNTGAYQMRCRHTLSLSLDSAVLSISHTLVTSTFQGQPLLSNSCLTASSCSWSMLLWAPPLWPN